jgi:TrmH family RNA methyltransferase
MISKNEIKYLASLNQKKNRILEKKFLVEGLKIVLEGIDSYYPCEMIICTFEFSESEPDIIKNLIRRNLRVEIINSTDFQKFSDAKTPQGIIAVFKFEKLFFDTSNNHNDKIVFIDNVSDPGNLGTILRNCDWFGINEILISSNSVEYLNPKVIRASMGSIFHLTIYDDVDYKILIEMKRKNYQIICSDLDGINLYEYYFPKKFIISFSSEASGISDELNSIADKFITIPKIGNAESLNVGVASGIILSKLQTF